MKFAPQTANDGVRRWAKYQWTGSTGGRCGSHARMGRPLLVREGASAQLLDAAVMKVL